MFRLVSVWILFGFAIVAIVGDRSRLPAAPEIANLGGYKEVQLNGHKFKIPIAFDITVCALSDVVPRPISAAFDDQGRLYVSDSSGSNEKSDVQLQKKPHRILRLKDKNADGKFESVTVFAENMMFPEGTMWLNGS